MSAKISGKVWELKLDPIDKLVLLALADHADHEGNNVRPGNALLCAKTGLSERTIGVKIAKLTSMGLLDPVTTTTGRGNIREFAVDADKGERHAYFVEKERRKAERASTFQPEKGRSSLDLSDAKRSKMARKKVEDGALKVEDDARKVEDDGSTYKEVNRHEPSENRHGESVGESKPPASADALSGLLSVLLNAYRNIIRTPRDQTDLSWQVSQLHSDGVTVQELQEWLRSRNSLSAIRFIAQDFRLWRENLIRDRERRNAEAYVGSNGNHPAASVSYISSRDLDAFDEQQSNPPTLPERTGQWGEVLNHLDRLIDPKPVNTWFAPLELADVTEQVVTLRATNPVFRDWIEANYRDQLLEALTAAGVANQDIAIVFEICRPAEEQAA